MPANNSFEVFLKIETGTHSAVIHSLRLTADRQRLVSAGADKTIRVWDMQSRKENRKILGQIGHGSEGAVLKIALTPDDRYLLAAVRMGESNDAKNDLIRVYDLESGNLEKIFLHGGEISSLDIAADGSYLLVADIEGRVINLFDLEEFLAQENPQPAHRIDFEFPYQPFGARIYQVDDDYRVVSGNWDLYGFQHTTSMYSIKEGQFLVWGEASVDYNPGNPIEAFEHFAISDRHIAACGHYNEDLFIFDLDFNLQKQITCESRPSGLAFSPDGMLLLAGAKATTRNHPLQCIVFDVEDDFKVTTRYRGHDSQAVAVAFLDNQTAITAGGSSQDIHFWEARSGEIEEGGIIHGVGNKVFAVGLEGGKRIAFGNQQQYSEDVNNYAPLQRTFDLENFSVGKLNGEKADTFKRAVFKRGKKSLKYTHHEPSNINLFLQPDGECFTWGMERGWYYAETFGFTPDGWIITGERNGTVRAYKVDRHEDYSLAKYLRGHTDATWDHAVDGDWLVTGSADQTFRLWYLPDVKKAAQEDAHEIEEMVPALSFFVGSDDEWIAWSDSGYYSASLHGDRYVGYHVNQGELQEALFFASDRFLKELYRPDVIRKILQTGSEKRALKELGLKEAVIEAILPPVVELYGPRKRVTGDFETRLEFEVRPATHPVKRIWILRNDQFVWHDENEAVQQGGRFSQVIPLLPGENAIKILAESEVAKSNPVALTVWVRDEEAAPGAAEAAETPPPAEVAAPTVSAHLDSTTINFEVASPQEKIDSIQMLRDGEVIWKESGWSVGRGGRFSVPVPIIGDQHQVEVRVEAAGRSSKLLSLQINNSTFEIEGVKPLKKQVFIARAGGSQLPADGKSGLVETTPNLYILAIGVSEYKNAGPGLKNLEYAHKDASEIVNAFVEQEGTTYSKVVTKLLTNQDATKDNIEEALIWLQIEIQNRETEKRRQRQFSRDVTLFFLAGHGVNDRGTYYFLNHDVELNDLAGSGVRLMDLGYTVTSLPSEVVVMTDTCHSGLIGREIIRNIDAEELAKRLIAINERAQFILNATTADRPSLESPLYEHGLFTYSILKSFLDYKQITMLRLSDSVQEMVMEMTEKQQIPTVRTYGDVFPYYIYKKSG